MDILVIIICGILGATFTYFMNNKLQLGGVMASSGISVIAGGIFYLFPEFLNPFLTKNIPLVIMGSSFIGMATSRVVKKQWNIAVSGLFFATIYLLTGSFFEGYGGSLGTTAAISLCAAFAINQSFNKVS